jgi:type II restriction/modification system DNA methylase subunit YeeA
MLAAVGNPNGRSNREVVRPWRNGSDVTGRSAGKFIIDFAEMSEADAALYEAPFEYVKRVVKPQRSTNNREHRRVFWWHHGETMGGLRAALAPLDRYIVTPMVAKHRLFVWLDKMVFPDQRLIVFAREDDYYFGVLHSRIHEVWSLATSSRHGMGNDPVYNNTTCFEAFPFPETTIDQREAIAQAAAELNRQREGWLDPPGATEAELKSRTLTNLYNQRPTWLANAHRALDDGVFAAYGWPADLADEEILARLLDLDLVRDPA